MYTNTVEMRGGSEHRKRSATACFISLKYQVKENEKRESGGGEKQGSTSV